jgi:SAM-dependent methyltransferase
MPKHFDERYFDRWYRDPAFRIGTAADLERLVRFAVAAAEYVLARPIRSVLDVGAGEGRWAPVLRRLRPRASYHGVDPSDYAVARYGRRRNIVRGTLDDLDALFGDRVFDLVVCCSVLNYLPRAGMTRGIAALARHTGGLAYLEIYATTDDVIGDTAGWHSESAATYRRIARHAGLVPCGLSCYVPAAIDDRLVALERAAP